MTLSTCNYSKVPNQEEVHIHEGPGNTRDAVEPEAWDRWDIFLEQVADIVLVRLILSDVAEEELDEGLDLSGNTRWILRDTLADIIRHELRVACKSHAESGK